MGLLIMFVIIGILAALAYTIVARLVRLMIRLTKIALGAIYAGLIGGCAAVLAGSDVTLPTLLALMTGSWFTWYITKPVRKNLTAVVPANTPREPKADSAVAEAWDKALAIAPLDATAILQARTPCALLLARSASNDLDFPTIEVVQMIRRHIPELVDGYCGIISTLDPVVRKHAIAEMIRDLSMIAAMAQTRLDFIAARRRDGLAVQREHLSRRAASEAFA